MPRAAATLITLCLLLGFGAVPAAAAEQVAGMQTHLLWSGVDDAEVSRQLDLVKASGASLTRVDVGWASLQQSRSDRYEGWFLDRLDGIVAEADARGIDLLLTFMNTPCWASTAPDTLKQGCTGAWWDRGVTAYPPAEPQAYARAIGYLAGRYRGRVAAWEIWNEPNHSGFWRTADQAGSYARLLKAAYPAVKAADPGAIVVGGSLSQSDYAFTQRLYELGVKGSFDAFAVHPYTDDVSPLDPRSTVDARYSFIRGVPKIRQVMLANRDDRPIWLTESGWSTSTVRTSDPWRNGVSEATQARFLREQFEQVARWPWVKVNIWFNLLDMGPDRQSLYVNCGLRRVDGSAKPAWAAFRDAAARLAAQTAAPPPPPTPAPVATPAPTPPTAPAPTAPAPAAPAPAAPAPAAPAPAAPAPAAPAPAAPAPARPAAETPARRRAKRHRTARARAARARARAKARRARRAAARRARARRAAARRAAAQRVRLRKARARAG